MIYVTMEGLRDEDAHYRLAMWRISKSPQQYAVRLTVGGFGSFEALGRTPGQAVGNAWRKFAATSVAAFGDFDG
jgi:hypothetical protein